MEEHVIAPGADPTSKTADKLRLVRIAVSVVSGVCCLLVIALWIRSYFWIDTIDWFRSPALISATVYRGQIGATRFRLPASKKLKPPTFERHSARVTAGTQVNYNNGAGKRLPSYLGFKSTWLSAPGTVRANTFVTPFWFPTFVLAFLAAVPHWRLVKWRFSLRTLLIVTTLVAVGLAAALYSSDG